MANLPAKTSLIQAAAMARTFDPHITNFVAGEFWISLTILST